MSIYTLTVFMLMAFTKCTIHIDTFPSPIISASGQFNDSEWGIATCYGHKLYQEDRYSTKVIDIDGFPIFYSAFDGHNGHVVAQIANDELYQWIITSIIDSIGTNFASKHLTDKETEKIKTGIIKGMLQFDRQRIYDQGIYGGSTFIGILQTKSHYFVINLGNSQARIYSSKTQQIIYRTKLHDLSNEIERNRISRTDFVIDETKFVNSDEIEIISRHIRNPYTGNKIDVPRSFGDNEFKDFGVVMAISCMPDIEVISKADYSKDVYGDLYAFLLTDGIGDLIEFGEKYSNVSTIPYWWKMNFMKQKPINGTDHDIMNNWAKTIVETMMQPIYRTHHNNMGILIAKLT